MPEQKGKPQRRTDKKPVGKTPADNTLVSKALLGKTLLDKTRPRPDKGPGTKDGKPGTPPTYAPKLLIPCDPNDTGEGAWQRPLPANVNFWSSPAITVSPTDALGNPIAGTDTTITVRIRNLSPLAPALATTVKFYAMEPSLGVMPADLLASTMVNVPASQEIEVVCPLPWVPDLGRGAHQCLLVQCTCPTDAYDVTPFAPALDRRVGQRNITVVSAGAIPLMQLRIGNPFRRSKTFTLQHAVFVIEGSFERLADAPQRLMARLAAMDEMSKPRGGDVLAGNLRVTRLDPGRFAPRQHGKRLATAIKPIGPDHVFGRITLKPGETRAIDVELPAVPTRPGQFVVHRVTQVSSDHPVGGYSVVVTPEKYRTTTPRS